MNLISLKLRIKFFIAARKFDWIAKRTVKELMKNQGGIRLYFEANDVFDAFCKEINIDSYELAESDIDYILSMSRNEIINVIKTII